jgi:hypothetical protein
MKQKEYFPVVEILGEERKILEEIQKIKKQMEKNKINYTDLTEIEIYNLLKRKSASILLQNLINYEGWIIFYSVGQIKDEKFQSLLKELIKARYIRKLPMVIGNPLRIQFPFMDGEDIALIDTDSDITIPEIKNKIEK